MTPKHPLRDISDSGPMMATSQGVSVIRNPGRVLVFRKREHGEKSDRPWQSFSLAQAAALKGLLERVLDVE